MPAPFPIPKGMKIMKLREKALYLRYLYSARVFTQHISWARRITQLMLQWPGYASQCRNHVLGSTQKGQVQEVMCRVTQVLESRALNPQPAGCSSSQVTVPSMFQQLVQTAFLTQGSLKPPHEVAILGWDSFAKLYVEIGLEDFVPTMYWNQSGRRNNWFRWFWTQWKRILLYKQNLEAFALNSSALKHLTWNLAGM